jgi:cellulose synthase/poly-beta-1,6-N-acetylglucosamine synthase-like glycosyltransferase
MTVPGSSLLPEPRSAERFEFSVVIPARDALPLLLDAIDSVLAQTLPPAEIVVVDDGSSDGTAEVVASRYARHPEVRVLPGRFGSAGAARNAGWRAATRPWIAFLDADDVWFPEKLAATAAALGSFPVAGWFFSDGTFKPLDGAEWCSWLAAYAEIREPYVGRPIAELLEVNFILTSSVVVRRSLLESLGGFDPDMSHAEDIDLWIRLARSSPATAGLRPLVRYRASTGRPHPADRAAPDGREPSGASPAIRDRHPPCAVVHAAGGAGLFPSWPPGSRPGDRRATCRGW